MIKKLNIYTESGFTDSYPEHGGNPKEVALKTGINSEILLDFSASINPLGPPPCVSQLLLETPHLINEYPDSNCKTLIKRIAESENVPEEWIRVTNGSTELIYLLPFLFSPNQELLIINPIFTEYEKSFSRFNIQIHSHLLSADNGFKIQLLDLLKQLESIDKLGGIVLGHPNSPTGNLQTHAFKELIEYCMYRDISMFVDETFKDFLSPKTSIWDSYEENTHLVIIRSMTKFYSLPGLRLGYGILAPDKNETITVHQNPWSVNSLAQFIGSEVLLDKEFQNKTKSWLQSEKKFMLNALRQIKNIETFPSETNFILLRLLTNNTQLPSNLFHSLLNDGILLRNCGNFPGLNESYFRISLRSRRDNKKLLDAFRNFFLKTQL